MQAGRSAPDLAQVRAFLDHAGIARQKWPEYLRSVDEFPRTASGKVQKFVLREQLRAESASS
jgi:non-ribosomal peptide synthetase component E (peptide arylation enzyme)